MTKVEEVARALYEATPFKSEAGGYDQQTDVYKRLCMLMARAAIEAMRMMTPAMDRARHDAGILNACDTSCAAMTDYRVTKIWTAMIDAALSEP